VDDISFSVNQGEIFGIIGLNGAGKTTTVVCIPRLRKPDSGMVQRLQFRPSNPFDDCSPTGLPEVRRVIHSEGKVIADGFGELLQAVTSALARSQIFPIELQIKQAGLDEACFTPTGHKLSDPSH
jgi:ABC-2 type transport system ATP-binding protein